MSISLIVAAGSNNEIGKNNTLIWHMPADMKFFKEKTTGHCIITGRKNYESIPEKFRPLPGRTNIVITRQKDYSAPGAIVVNSVDTALAQAEKLGEKEVFIIGGAEIYHQSFNKLDKLYITHVDESFEADTFFPEFNKNNWSLESKELFQADNNNKYDCAFCVYSKR